MVQAAVFLSIITKLSSYMQFEPEKKNVALVGEIYDNEVTRSKGR